MRKTRKGPGPLFTQRRLALLCCGLLGVSLLPVAAIAFYNHPCSDDYSYGLYVAQAVRAEGSLWEVLAAAGRETAETYLDWQGTFSAVFLMALQPAAFGEGFYALTPYLMAGSLLFSNFFFLKEVCVRRLGMSRWGWLITGCALGFFLIHFAPDPFEGFFWYNGSLFYTFFHSVMLCALALALKFLRLRGGRGLACGLGAGALCFFVGGGNYPTALLTCVLLLAGFAYSLWKKLPLSRRVGCLAFFLLEVCAFAVSILAPGNAVRQAHFENRPGALQSILLALGAAARCAGEWATLPLVLALLFLCPLFCQCAARLRFSFPLPGLAPAVALCLLGVLLTPPIYAMGGTGAGRMEDLYFDAFVLLAAGVAFYLCGWAVHRPGLWKALRSVRPSLDGAILSLVVCFALATAALPGFSSLTGVSAGLSLLRGEAQAYHAQVLAQVEVLSDSSVSDAVVEPVTARPQLLLPTSVPVLSDDPESPVNQRVATFYGKDSVRIPGEE